MWLLFTIHRHPVELPTRRPGKCEADETTGKDIILLLSFLFWFISPVNSLVYMKRFASVFNYRLEQFELFRGIFQNVSLVML
jgi:hypothetical protein